MSTIILSTNTQKQSRTCNSVSQHSQNRSKNSNFVQSEKCLYYHTHMSYTTICNNFFQIYLSQSSQTCIDNSNQTDSPYLRSQKSTSFRKQIKIETQLSISSLFQQYSCLLYTSCSTPFYMSLRQPQMQRHQRNFDCKSQKKSPPHKLLTTRFNRSKGMMPLLQIIGGSCPTVQLQQTGKHCLTSYQSIKNQQISSTNFTGTTSTQSNLQKHRQKSTFIKNIKALQILTCKTSKQKTFQSLQLPIKRLTMSILSIPTTQNCLWNQSCCKQHHPKTQTVQSKFLFHCKLSTPICREPYYLLKRFHCSWNKTRPQTHTQHLSLKTKKLRKNTMLFPFFSWLKTKKKSSPLRLQQHSLKKSFLRNRQKQSCSKHTKTNYLRPHFCHPYPKSTAARASAASVTIHFCLCSCCGTNSCRDFRENSNCKKNSSILLLFMK